METMADRVEENMTSSIDEEREDMNKLNAQLATYKVMKETQRESNKHLLREMSRLKEEFLQTQSMSEKKYIDQIKEMISIRKQSGEGAALEAKCVFMEKDLKMKITEICDLKKQTWELHETLREKDVTIGNLEVNCNALKIQKKVIKQEHDRIREELIYIWEEQQTTLTSQTKAQYECESLQKEKTYLEKCLHIETEKFRNLLSTFEFSQNNFKEIQNTVYTKCIKEIQAEYECHFARLRKVQQGPYKEKIERLEEEIVIMTTSYEEKCSYFERRIVELQYQIRQKERELREQEQSSCVRVGNLRTEISLYRKLLAEKIEIEEDISSQTGQHCNDNFGPDKSPRSSEDEHEDCEPKKDDTEAQAGQQAKHDSENSSSKHSSSSSEEEDKENGEDEKTKQKKTKSTAARFKDLLDLKKKNPEQHKE